MKTDLSIQVTPEGVIYVDGYIDGRVHHEPHPTLDHALRAAAALSGETIVLDVTSMSLRHAMSATG